MPFSNNNKILAPKFLIESFLCSLINKERDKRRMSMRVALAWVAKWVGCVET